MKLLHLANDFALPEMRSLTISPKVIVKAPAYLQGEPRRKPVIALLILLFFAGLSLTIPLHPTRSAVPNACSTAAALPDGESAAACIYQATNPARPSSKYALLPDTPDGYLVNSQVVSIQLATVMFVKTVKDNFLTGHNRSANQF